jgi:hypothetical protein
MQKFKQKHINFIVLLLMMASARNFPGHFFNLLCTSHCMQRASYYKHTLLPLLGWLWLD